MQALSQTIQPEPIGYTPKGQKKYQTPTDFDLNDIMAFTKGQPHDFFHKLRKQAPVSWWDFPADARVQGYWALTRYEDVKAVDLDAKTYSSGTGGILSAYSAHRPGPKRLQAAALNSLINLDQPHHIPLRMAHRPFFTPDYVAQLQKRVENEVDRLLDNLEAEQIRTGAPVNFVEHFAQWLPMFTLCEMLGVAEKDRRHLIRWMHYLELSTYIVADPEKKISLPFMLKFLWNIRQMFRYGERVLLDRRKNPRDDLLTVIANTEIDEELLDQYYLDGSWLLIVFAGNDTTRNSLSGTMRLMTQFPEQKQMVLDEPALVSKMVPEALRLVSPVMYMRRTVLADTEISGQPIAEGEKVVMWYGAANRDPEIFSDPDTMDMHRANADKHLAFGTGPHVCLGQRIANMQLETAYQRILDRFPNIKWTGIDDHQPNNFVHAISRVDVDLGLNGK